MVLLYCGCKNTRKIQNFVTSSFVASFYITGWPWPWDCGLGLEWSGFVNITVDGIPKFWHSENYSLRCCKKNLTYTCVRSDDVKNQNSQHLSISVSSGVFSDHSAYPQYDFFFALSSFIAMYLFPVLCVTFQLCASLSWVLRALNTALSFSGDVARVIGHL